MINTFVEQAVRLAPSDTRDSKNICMLLDQNEIRMLQF